MTLENFLQAATAELTSAGIESARLDCLLLLEDVFGRDRAYLLAHPELEIPTAKLSILNKNIAQRRTHQPLAYIRGTAAFYGRNFAVNDYVLVPRPETESIILLLKKIPFAVEPNLADIGTGSGCIGITAGLEIPGSKIWLTDIDPAALVVASKNASTHNLPVRTVESDLLTNLPPEPFDAILANLPYVPDMLTINKAATFEPKIALFAGPDGLDAYKRFWTQLAALAHKPAHVITEALPSQHHALAMLARAAGYYLSEREGFVQSFALLSE